MTFALCESWLVKSPFWNQLIMSTLKSILEQRVQQEGFISRSNYSPNCCVFIPLDSTLVRLLPPVCLETFSSSDDAVVSSTTQTIFKWLRFRRRRLHVCRCLLKALVEEVYSVSCSGPTDGNLSADHKSIKAAVMLLSLCWSTAAD